MKTTDQKTTKKNAYQILDAKLKKLEKEFADLKKANARSKKLDLVGKRA